jgi:hypothetical protein
MHVYPGNLKPADSDRLRRSLWFDLVTFADRWGLELSVLPRLWYNPESTVHVVLYPPERYRLYP